MQMVQIERAGLPAEARRNHRNEMQGIRLWLPRPHPDSKIEVAGDEIFHSRLFCLIGKRVAEIGLRATASEGFQASATSLCRGLISAPW